MPGILEDMRNRIAADHELLAAQLRDGAPAPESAIYSSLFQAACPPGSAGAGYLLGLEYIYEGYLLHYDGQSRVLTGVPGDFRLLAGDYMYARGLTHITALGDLFAVRVLADLVSLCSLIRLGSGEATGARSDGAAGLAARASGTAALAEELWDFSTLLLARGVAAGEPSCAAAAAGFADFREAVWRGAPGPDSLRPLLGALLDELLGSFTAEARERIGSLLAGIRQNREGVADGAR